MTYPPSSSAHETCRMAFRANGGKPATRDVVISIAGETGAPVIISTAAADVVEIGTAATTVTSPDPDAGAMKPYSIAWRRLVLEWRQRLAEPPSCCRSPLFSHPGSAFWCRASSTGRAMAPANGCNMRDASLAFYAVACAADKTGSNRLLTLGGQERFVSPSWSRT